jgi:hypothetical protein
MLCDTLARHALRQNIDLKCRGALFTGDPATHPNTPASLPKRRHTRWALAIAPERP